MTKRVRLVGSWQVPWQSCKRRQDARHATVLALFHPFVCVKGKAAHATSMHATVVMHGC